MSKICLLGAFLGICTSRGAQAPSFTLEPWSQSVAVSNSVTFTTAATGATPLTYQWWFNGTSLPGQTNTSLTLLSANATNAGNYWVAVTNSHGGIVSSNAALTVGYPPIIAQQPVSEASVLNSNTAFAVTVTGTPPLAYQWRLNGQNLSGATASSLNLPNMQFSNTGSYAAVVTNSYGSATSAPVTLVVATPPDFLWARNVTNTINGYTGVSYARNAAIDGAGNVFIVGYYQGWGVDFGGAVLTNNSFNATVASFLCKYDQWGNFQWVTQISTNGYYGLRVATDPTGNIYVTGNFKGTNIIGTNVLFSTDPTDMFLAKYDAQGHAMWARRIGAYDPNSDTSGRGFAVDGSGNTFIFAAYSGTADFGTTNVSGTSAFLASFDGAGNLLWARGLIAGTSLAIGQSGAVYTCGLILSKYDNAGNLLWSRPFAWAQSMVLNDAEDIYATGIGNGTYGDLTVTNVGGLADFFVAKCDSNGNLVWSRQMGSTKQQTGMSISLDGFDNVYVGSISASANREPLLTFGNTTLTNVMTLLVKYDAAGNPLWARALGGTNRAQPTAVRVLNPGAVFVAGTLYGSGQFGSFSLINASPTSLENIYVARLAGVEPPALPQIVSQPQDQTVRAGNTAAFNVTTGPSGIPLTYQWYFNATNALPSAIQSSLVFTNAQPSAFGNYFVSVANTYGAITSSVATLTVYLTEAATLNSPSLAGPNQLQFQIGGVPGFSYAVEASTNLTDWVRLSTNTAPAVFTDQPGGTFPQRFYRVVWMP